MSELVTGEAVVLGLRPAKLASRAVAVAVDLVVWWGTYLAVSIALVSATASLDTAALAAVTVATLLLVLVGLPIAVETLSQGRSLGKLLFGLRVVRDDGGPIRFRHALVRGAVGAVEIQLSMGVIACIASLASARGRRLGDVFAGTLVVRERVPSAYAQQPPPPSWMEGRLSSIDLSGLPDELWLAIRQYLSRMRQLDQQVSWSMAERLAGDVAARTGRAVPEGVPPAAYLAAVVAERQQRDAQRVLGAQAEAASGGSSFAAQPWLIAQPSATDPAPTAGGTKAAPSAPMSQTGPSSASPTTGAATGESAPATSFAAPGGPAATPSSTKPSIPPSAGSSAAHPPAALPVRSSATEDGVRSGAGAGVRTGEGGGTGFAPPA